MFTHHRLSPTNKLDCPHAMGTDAFSPQRAESFRPTLCATQLRLPLDKSEGVVKDKDLLCSAEHRVFRQRLRTKTLEISR